MRTFAGMRRFAVLAVIALTAGALVAGPAAAGHAAGAPSAAVSPGDTLRSFVEAAGKGDAGRMWSLLSTQTQRRFGPISHAFARGWPSSWPMALARSRAPAATG